MKSFLGLIIFLFSFPLTAQWEIKSLPGYHKIDELMYFQGYIFACTYQRIYRSADEGLHWEPVFYKDQIIYFSSLSNDGTNVYVIASNGSLYRSTDLGSNWEVAATDLWGKIIVQGDNLILNDGSKLLRFNTTLLSNPPDTIYTLPDNVTANIISVAANDSILWRSSPEGLYKSKNAGNSWDLVDTFMFFTSFDLNGDTILGRNWYDNSLWRSLDGGTTWLLSYPDIGNNKVTHTGNIWACYSGSPHVFVTTNAGSSWDTLPGGKGSTRDFLKVGDVFFRATQWGVTRSDNSGNTWAYYSNGLAGYQGTISEIDSILFSSYGAYSTDHGGTWIYPVIEVNGLEYFGLPATLVKHQGVYYGIRNSALVSCVNADFFHWNEVTGNNIAPAMFHTVRDFVSMDSALILITLNYFNDSLYFSYSKDQGQTWHLNEPLTSDNQLYAYTIHNNQIFTILKVGDEFGLYCSDDFGNTWQPRDLDLSNVLLTNPKFQFISSEGRLFIFTGFDVWVSINQGISFEPVDTENYLYPLGDPFLQYADVYGPYMVAFRWNSGLNIYDLNQDYWFDIMDDNISNFVQFFFHNEAVYIVYYDYFNNNTITMAKRDLSTISFVVNTETPRQPHLLSLKISPNPSGSFFEINLDEPLHNIGQLRITDLLGRTILRQPVDRGINDINISIPDAPDGIYNVQIQDGHTTRTGKLMLRR